MSFDKTPKPLFSPGQKTQSESATPIPQAINPTRTTAIKTFGDVKTFDGVAPSAPKQSTSTTQAGKQLFQTDDDPNVIKAAVAYVQQTYGQMGFAGDRIEKQIRQLSPLKLDVLMNWGMKAVEENGRLASESAKVVRTYSELNSTELMDAALKAARDVPTNKTLMERVFGDKPVDLLSLKPKLVLLKSELDAIAPQIDTLIANTAEMEKRLILNVAALAATCEVNDNPTDQAMARTMHDRRTILTQASNQCKLVNLQLSHTRSLVVDQQTRLVQLVNVTLPTFEMANATK